MALSAHELLLILRARDEASKVLRGFSRNLAQVDAQATAAANAQFARGSALATSGVAVAAVGVTATMALSDMVDQAIAYNQEAAKTVTQLDKVKLSLEGVKTMGREVALTVPAAFEQMQPALYDIFSSIDTNAPGARILLEGIAKSAVGGAVSMEQAGRAAITILNAYKRPAQDINNVNDVMFQLVRKGVGTYDEFTKTIGRAIPSGIKYGQSFEEVAGAMAFMTRNGLSTAMSATSVARAMDALSNAKTVKNFRDFGVQLVDTKGKFRPLSTVMDELGEKMKGLTPAARAAKLNELFKGSGGTIQAMRFFNHAVTDSHGLLQTLAGDMKNAEGAAAQAYKTMSNTPQAKMQLLSNRYAVMATIIGDKLLPIKMALVDAISSVINWFLKLDPNVQGIIIKAAALAAGLTIVVGVVTAIAGVFLMFSAAANMAGTSVLGVLGPVGLVAAAIIGLVAAGIWMYKNWDTIKAKAIEVWGSMQSIIQPVVDMVIAVGKHIADFAKEIWAVIGPPLVSLWETLSGAIGSMWVKIKPYWDKFTAVLTKFRDNAQEIFRNVGGQISWLFDFIKPVLFAIAGVFSVAFDIIKRVVVVLVDVIGSVIGNVIQIITGLIDFVINVFTGEWHAAWDAVVEILKGIWGIIAALFVGARDLIWGIIEGFIGGVIGYFQRLWDVLVGHSIVPDMIKAIVMWFASLPGKVLAFVLDLVVKVVAWFLSLYLKVIATVTNLVVTAVKWFAGLPGKVLSAIASLASSLYAVATSWIKNMYDAIVRKAADVWSWFSNLWTTIRSKIGDISSNMYSVGSGMIQGMINGIKGMAGSIAQTAKSVVSNAVQGVKNFLGMRSPSKVFEFIGVMSGVGLANGLNSMKSLVSDAGTSLAAAAISGVAPVVSGTAGLGSQVAVPGNSVNVDMKIYTQEIDPVKHAADLGWQFASKVA